MIGVPISSAHLCRILVVTLLVSAFWGPFPLRAADQEAESALPNVHAPNIQQRRKQLDEEKKLIRLFADTLEQVKSKYVKANVSERELIEAAIQGMISRLDPYSNYIPPQDLDQFRKGIDREFIGIGIQVSDRDGHLQITSPLFDTPAWHAGLRAGDKILKINDTSTRGLSIDDAVKLMSGDVGTEVSITVLHPDGKKAETVKLIRQRIQQPTVIGFHRDLKGVWDYFCDHEQRIGYVRITAFSGKTSRDLRRILTRLLEQGMRGLVVDLRFNPGGMLKQAIQVSDMFLHKGRIVSIEGRSTRHQAWDAKPEGTLIPKAFPVAVLVNRFSASAAEIVSACLQDNQAATIIGERTWGKGSVQNIIVLDDGKSALKLTTAGYHRPSGKNIHREVGASEKDQWGVHPDKGFVIRLSNQEMRDLGLWFGEQDELTKIRRQKTAKAPLQSNGADRATPDRATPDRATANSATADRPTFVDRQLQKALATLRSQIVANADATEKQEAGQNNVVPAEKAKGQSRGK